MTNFTPQQKLNLSVACAVFDEGMILLKGPQLGLTENEARAFLEELTIRVRDRLEKNKDFTPQQDDEAHYRYTKLRVAVVAMRDAQKNYFRTRDQKWLNQSKALEKRVDDLLAEK